MDSIVSEVKGKHEICEYDEMFKYKIGQTVNDNVILEYVILSHDTSRGVRKRRGFVCKCVRDGYVRVIEQYKLHNGIHGCAICDNKIVVET